MQRQSKLFKCVFEIKEKLASPSAHSIQPSSLPKISSEEELNEFDVSLTEDTEKHVVIFNLNFFVVMP